MPSPQKAATPAQTSTGEQRTIDADAYRTQHDITIKAFSSTPGEKPPVFQSFEEAPFPTALQQALAAAGFTAPSPIQVTSERTSRLDSVAAAEILTLPPHAGTGMAAGSHWQGHPRDGKGQPGTCMVDWSRLSPLAVSSRRHAFPLCRPAAGRPAGTFCRASPTTWRPKEHQHPARLPTCLPHDPPPRARPRSSSWRRRASWPCRSTSRPPSLPRPSAYAGGSKGE